MTAALYVFPVTDTPPSPGDLLTVREVAALLDLHIDTVRKLIYSGALPGELDERDRNYRIRRVDAEAYRDGHFRGDPSPMFAELGAYDDLIEACRRLERDTIAQRDQRMVALNDEGQTVTAIAKATRMGRQHVTRILRATRAEIRAQRPPQ